MYLDDALLRGLALISVSLRSFAQLHLFVLAHLGIGLCAGSQGSNSLFHAGYRDPRLIELELDALLRLVVLFDALFGVAAYLVFVETKLFQTVFPAAFEPGVRGGEMLELVFELARALLAGFVQVLLGEQRVLGVREI